MYNNFKKFETYLKTLMSQLYINNYVIGKQALVFRE